MKFEDLRSKVSKFFVGGAIAAMPLTMSSCSEEALDTALAILDELLNSMGYLMNEENVEDENSDEVYDGDGTLDSKVDWTAYTPAVGNQGAYGTCVAWATGYGLKTTLNNIDAKRTNAKATTSLQTSPIDLWHLMAKEANAVSSKCGGSSFDPAFKVMINKGVATMSSVPFTNQKMVCDGASPVGNTSNKLGAFRLVAYTRELSGTSAYGMTVDNIKSKLQKGPLVVGAKLGEQFMKWNNSQVITVDDPDSYNGGHAYHAMLIVGYDDSRRAFRIQNSWGASEWGDNGFIWVGYNHFISNFAFGVWSASNDANAYNNVASTASTRAGSGVDLKLNVISDEATENGMRKVTYDIVNNGNVDVDLSDCNVVYTLFKKKHFHEKAILANVNEKVVLPAGATASSVLGNTLTIEYKVPEKLAYDMDSDGDCYLFMALDPKNNAEDSDLSNNFAFVTSADAKPLNVIANEITGKTNVYSADLRNKFTNDYTGVELIGRLAKEMK
ncbi:MAG: C1 family peptidase [Paludibacteraceae bacterium]|nr:C1 family peptidase [Paludibacteraceae bacterium]